MLSTRIEAGLPNITGSCGISRDFDLTGAFYTTDQHNTTRANGKDWTTRDGHFDASRSNPDIYGASDTVTPESTSTLLILKY